MSKFISDFKQLTKFGLSVSVVISSIAGYLIAVDSVNYKTLLLLTFGGYCMVGASNAYNQIIEKIPDGVMPRTKDRPLPSGRMSTNTALIIAVILTFLGLIALILAATAAAQMPHRVAVLVNENSQNSKKRNQNIRY